MAENRKKTVIRLRRGTPGQARYVACDDGGNPIKGFNKISEARQNWRKEIQWGCVELVRELDQFPDMDTVNKTIAAIDGILKAYARR